MFLATGSMYREIEFSELTVLTFMSCFFSIEALKDGLIFILFVEKHVQIELKGFLSLSLYFFMGKNDYSIFYLYRSFFFCFLYNIHQYFCTLIISVLYFNLCGYHFFLICHFFFFFFDIFE